MLFIQETKDLVIGYTDPLSKPLTIAMERKEKIAMVGANGIGKTTLLKSILGLIPPLSGTVHLGDYLAIGYFEIACGNARFIASDKILQFTDFLLLSPIGR